MAAALGGIATVMKRRRFLEVTGGMLAGAAHRWMVADPARIASRARCGGPCVHARVRPGPPRVRRVGP